MKTHYDLLELEPGASAEDIKHAFRQQIARYHPDKVQHLGRELQDLAATRTAELTEAYGVLSHPVTRQAYDQALDAARRTPAPEPATPADAPAPEPVSVPGRGLSSQDLSRRDDVVRRAAVNRLRSALVAECGAVEASGARGFDLACVPRHGLFSRERRPHVLGRFVDRVDAAALIDTWKQAAAWTEKDVCVFLMGSDLAPARELAEATAARRRAPSRTGQVVVVPVDARDWQALVPQSAPAIVHAVLDRLRAGG